jgi:hypothetical protein
VGVEEACLRSFLAYASSDTRLVQRSHSNSIYDADGPERDSFAPY